MVPAEATGSAQVIVGYLMIRTLSERETGIGAGLLSYVAIRAAGGEWRKVHPLRYAIAVVFLFSFLAPLLTEWLKA
jgi:xanthine/uracil/vitamin C permease (AzgA family)